MKKSAAVAVFTLAAIVSSICLAADWPQYRGPAGDGVSSASITNTDWASKPPKVLWKVPTPLGFSSMAVADGRVFTLVARDSADGAKVETCIALDANTGKELWSVTFGKSEYGHDGGNAGAPGNRGGDGPRSTPTTDGKLVWVYDAHMVLACLDAATGKEIWKRDIVKEFDGRPIKWFNATSPLIVGDAVIVSGGGKDQSFLAFNKNDGKVIWKSGDETITHATPRLADIGSKRQLVFFVQSGLVGVDPASGKELWRSKFPFNVSTAASPVIEDSRIFCSAGYGVGAQLVEVGEDQEAKRLWFKANQLMNHWSTPLAHKGHLYGIFEFKKYGKAPLQCVDMATGEIKWSTRGFGPGNCILVGDKLVVLPDAGDVVLVQATPDEYKELARIKALKGKCWSTPAYSDGRIYVRSTEEAACLVVD
ncbi:MAG: PQQ-like beta-propeller repeat protein [Pirellulales bacterium]|nr:PQQ-like beta-propeller repeat protein [Pirellulales bacterium]